jgi:hypothetical protein
MSQAIDLPDPPAFRDPGRDIVEFETAAGEGGRLVASLFPPDTRVERLRGAGHREPFGHYRVACRDGLRRFVRVLSSDRQEQCVAVARLLAQLPEGSPIVAAGVPQRLSDFAIAVVSPWVEHRAPRLVASDLDAIGRAMGTLHCGLAVITERVGVETRARHRRQHFEQRFLLPVPERARRLVQEISGSLSALDDLPGQPLHGDPNPGNILMTQSGVRFCDFENAVHAFGPPILDLAMIVERLCLPCVEAERLAAALFEGWMFATGTTPIPRPGALADALRIRNLTVAAVLVLLEDRGTPAEEAEWAKFEALAAQLGDRRKTVSAIEAMQA